MTVLWGPFKCLFLVLLSSDIFCAERQKPALLFVPFCVALIVKIKGVS